MTNFAAGIAFGIIIATIGITGIAKVVDKGVDQTKVILKEQAK
jgi:hypothetical protein